MVTEIKNYINGEFTETASRVSSDNPATEETLCSIPSSTPEDALKAVAAAHQAQKAWAKTPLNKRLQLIDQLHQEFKKNYDFFASEESKDQGKCKTSAEMADIPAVDECFTFWAKYAGLGQLEKLGVSEMPAMCSQSLTYTHKTPVGVVTIITPWNYPLLMVVIKLVPCLIYGNTCVIKPSEVTSLTAFRLSELIDKVGLPKGIVNFVYGAGSVLGPVLTTDVRVRAVAFTGSTATGRIINKNAADTLKKVALECGGKNPAVIFEDCDIDKAVNQLTMSCFLNNGEICVTNERVYVQESILEQFLEKFVENTKTWKVGYPDDADSSVGPLSCKVHYEKVTRTVDEAIENGARIECGYGHQDYKKFSEKGYFFAPTIITNIDHSFKICQDEVFGPIACVMGFKSENEAIELANDTTYGLSAAIFTENNSRAHRVAQQIEAGVVWVNQFGVMNQNMPFGGHKGSGLGREGAQCSEEFFTEIKTVSMHIDLDVEGTHKTTSKNITLM